MELVCTDMWRSSINYMNQSNNMIYILITGIFLLIIVIVWVLLGLRVIESESIAQVEEDTNTSIVKQKLTPIQNNTPTAVTLLVNTKAGSPFSLPNFLNQPNVEQIDENVFLISSAQSQEGNLYEIFFYSGGGINISLQDANLSFARQQAESALRELIPESTMRLCSLEVSVTVPNWLSQQLVVDHSGINYGLSFCPDGLEI